MLKLESLIILKCLYIKCPDLKIADLIFKPELDRIPKCIFTMVHIQELKKIYINIYTSKIETHLHKSLVLTFVVTSTNTILLTMHMHEV